MTDPKDNEGFFRKMVRFVANPATDWTELNSRQDSLRETEFERSELKAMIERKRRNDFVRKREFDMLRKVRRDGLSPDQLAALGNSSKLDDTDMRAAEQLGGTQHDGSVKAKIDEIEQQMVGDGGFKVQPRRAPPPSLNAPVLPSSAMVPPGAPPMMTSPGGPVSQPAPPPMMKLEDSVSVQMEQAMAPAVAPAVPPAIAPLPNLNMVNGRGGVLDFSDPFAVEVSEAVVHDPELDEAVIAFANADFQQCEESLLQLTREGGARAQHAETWLVLFDLYRAIGQQSKFESLAVDYAQQFGWSAPQWFSLPKMVADAAGEDSGSKGKPAPKSVAGEIGWVCPEILDIEAVAQLSSQTLQMPKPWVIDWNDLRSVDPEACSRLTELFRKWSKEAVEMRWVGGERLFATLAEAAPTGVRDTDPAYWSLRLEALRLVNRPDQFDEAAIDYCVTYEVSPPSWEPAKCTVQVSSNTDTNTLAPPMSAVSDVATSFMESANEEPGSSSPSNSGVVQVASVELSGQLVGDIGPTLRQLDEELGQAAIVNVSCARLIRVDFIAAGDLLNWVLARRGENRAVSFGESHRLVALFFGAMGITEHAKVKVRTV